MTTTRKDADRPRVRCTDCRFHRPDDRVCPVANKVPVVTRDITCQRFKPLRRAERLARERATDHRATPAPAPAPLLLIDDAEEARHRLEVYGLAWAVTEIRLIDGRLAIRYHRDAGLDDMSAVIRCLTLVPDSADGTPA